MSASSTDKITDVRNGARPNSARVSTARTTGGANLACDSLSGWPTASKVHFVTYQIDTNSNPIGGTQLDCSGIVSGNTITSVVVIDGTDGGNSVGDVVEMLPTAAWGQDLSDALTAAHDRLGVHKSGATYASPVLSGTATGTYTLGGIPTISSPTITSPTISGTVTGAVIANANLSAATGEIGAAWASWTPTWTNLTIGNASVTAKYKQVGKTVHVRLRVALGSTSSVGTGPTFTLPIASVDYQDQDYVLAPANLTDAAVFAYAGYIRWDSTTTARFYKLSVNGSNIAIGNVDSTNPFTWGSGDLFGCSFTYETP